MQDAITILAFQSISVGFAGISFIRENTLSVASFNHGFKLWALTNIRWRGMDFIHKPFFIASGKTLVTQHTLMALLDPPGVVISTKDNTSRLIQGLIFSPIFSGHLYMSARMGCAFDQGRVYNGRSCLFHFQPMMFYLTADLGKQRMVNVRINQRIAKSTMCGLLRHAAI